MTIEELRAILATLGLDYDDKPSTIYVFYERPDGTVNNLSISVHAAHNKQRRKMSDPELAELMGGYPDTRDSKLLAIERPGKRLRQWADSVEVCELLHTSKNTLRRWSAQGWLTPHKLGQKIYYDRAEVDRLIASHALQENGRLDRAGQPKRH